MDSRNVRILEVTIAGAAVFGVVDGSMWRSLLTPTLAYRPAILFGLTLVFGWRVRVQSTRVFYGVCGVSWLARRRSHHTAVSVSRAGAFLVVRRLGGDQPWLSGQRSTLAFVTGAFLAPALPALFSADALSLIGITVHSDVPASVDSWLRGAAAILAIVPAL